MKQPSPPTDRKTLSSPIDRQTFKKVWKAPALLGACILFGLLAALFGTGIWYGLSWAALILPLLIAGWKILAARRKSIN